MSIPGITVPKLLPITGTFAPFFAGYCALLSMRVSLARVDTKQSLGSSSKEGDPATDPLTVAQRCHGNYVETVPIALLMGAIVEMNGGNRKALTGGFAFLLLMRILHVELGLRQDKANGTGRVIGSLGSLGFVLGMGGYAAWLVKGYWGL